jgi:YggT family protein
MTFVAIFLQNLFRLLNLIILVDIVISFFLSPYHPVRNFLDKIVNPLLSPIRKIMPQTGMFDFSPLILIILLQVIEYLVLIPFR